MKKPLPHKEIITTLQTDLKQRYDNNLKRKDPLSKMNIAELCYGRVFIEKLQAKLN